MTTKIEDTENINQQTINYKEIDEILIVNREIAKEYLRKSIS